MELKQHEEGFTVDVNKDDTNEEFDKRLESLTEAMQKAIVESNKELINQTVLKMNLAVAGIISIFRIFIAILFGTLPSLLLWLDGSTVFKVGVSIVMLFIATYLVEEILIFNNNKYKK